MANEFTIRTSLQLNNGNNQQQTRPTSFRQDQTNPGGPTPGEIIAPTWGVNVDFSQLTRPGLCWMNNLDPTNIVKVGIYDVDTNKFYPFLQLRPGKPQLIELVEDFGAEYTGTGTVVFDTNQRLRVMGVNGPCRVRIEAYEA